MSDKVESMTDSERLMLFHNLLQKFQSRAARCRKIAADEGSDGWIRKAEKEEYYAERMRFLFDELKEWMRPAPAPPPALPPAHRRPVLSLARGGATKP